jgi:hypothetical protein
VQPNVPVDRDGGRTLKGTTPLRFSAPLEPIVELSAARSR